VDTLPLTPSGKIDRRALPVPTGHASSTFVPPRDELERRIADVFAECLDVAVVGVHDHFFELGGDSLLAVRAVSELSSRLGVELSVGRFFEAPTVAGLAEAVRSGTAQTQALVVPLHAEGNRAPLFFICGIHLYQKLAQALGDEQPSYGIFLPVEQHLFASRGRHALTVEELAAMYADAMQKHTKDGPYLLAGVSFGGVLAFEMARALTARGVHVPLLVLIDPILPSAVRHNRRKWLAHQARELRRSGFRGVVDRTQRRVRGLLGPSLGASAENELDEMRLAVYRRAVRAYEGGDQRYAGRTLLIRAATTGFVGYDLDPMLGWKDRLTGEVTVHQSLGDHLGVVREPRTANIMRQALERAHERDDPQLSEVDSSLRRARVDLPS
jgi:thioesterase domain-containing protein/acyl carrier protein